MLASTAVLALTSALLVAGSAPARAAGEASVSVTPATTTADSGVVTTYTLSYTCSVTGGCPATVVTFPTTALTGNGPTTDFGAWLKQGTCPNLTVASGTATISLGTIGTGTASCAFTIQPPNYTTFNNAQATITPTISGTGFSTTGAAATLTVTAGHHTSIEESSSAGSVATGRAFFIAPTIVCGQHRGNPLTGDIGYTSIVLTDTLPANFTYTGWSNPLGSPPGATGSYDPTTRVFTYSDPTGETCNDRNYGFLANGNRGGNVVQIRLHGTASTNGTPNPVNSTICDTSAQVTVTYLDDGTTATFSVPGTATNCVTVTTPVPSDFSSKSTLTSGEYNGGQYPAPSPLASNTPYTYAGDWDATGSSARFRVLLSQGAASNGGVAFHVQDPMPCLDNQSGSTYSSLPPGPPYCQNPAFVPTKVTVDQGFTPTAANAITVVHPDGSTTSVPWAAGGWVIPTSPAVAQLDFPPWAEEGANTNGIIVMTIHGYAAASVPGSSVLTNTMHANAFNVGDTTPLTAANVRSSSLLVESPTPNATVVSPTILAVSQGAGTCKENVHLGNNALYNTVEIPSGSSKAIYVDYLAPVGATISSPADGITSFTLQQRQAMNGFYQQATTIGAAINTAAITPSTQSNYRGTGRTLYEWVIPAGTVTQPGLYSITPNTPSTAWVVQLPHGCAGVQHNDLTVGYDGPVLACLPYTGANTSLPPAKPVPTLPSANQDLNSNGVPNGNFCGASFPLNVAPVNPGFTVDKTVRGNLDNAPTSGGGIGTVSPSGGTATYRVTFTNNGGANLTNPVMYDLLPRLGDTGASSTTPRESQYGVSLTGVGPLPAGVTVAYSTATNPCRPEVLATNPTCTDDWTTTAPGDLSTVTALRIRYSGTVFVDPNSGTHSFTVPFTVSTPNVTPGQVAWNTVGTNAYAGNLIGAAESSRTGLQAHSGPTITKAAAPTQYSSSGDTITYTFTVTNNTSVPLTNVRVVDNLTDAAPGATPPVVTCQSLSSPSAACSGLSTTLQPGQTGTFTATYIVNQRDIDHGRISDTATVTAQPPTGGQLINTSAPVTVNATQTPSLAIAKTANPTAATAAGDVVTYSFRVANTGNVTLTGVTVNETAFTGSSSLSSISCPQTTLAPGAQVTCTATYALTQADVNAGSITNTATASATPPTGPNVTSAPDDAIVTIAAAPALALAKTANPTAVTTIGQTITYTLTVTNTGNVDLSDVQLVDALPGLSAITCASGPLPLTLAAGATDTCTATYQATANDFAAGRIVNHATASGQPPVGARVTSPEASAPVAAPAMPGLTIDKTAQEPNFDAAGDVLHFDFTVTNTGNVPLTDLVVNDQLAGTSPVLCDTTALAPTAVAHCTTTYPTTTIDMDTGGVTNTATATATAPGGPVTSPPDAVSVTALRTATITIDKSAAEQSFSAAGTTLHYRFVVANTGNVTLTNVTVTDPMPGLSAVDCGGITSLQAAAVMTCTATYTTTLTDVNNGGVTNNAGVTATPPQGMTAPSDTDDETVEALQAPAISIDKSVSSQQIVAAGQVITYTFVVSNTGNVTLTGVTVNDILPNLSAIDCGGVTTLAAGDDMTCTATYTVTQQDIDDVDQLINSATASGTTPLGATITSTPDSAPVPPVQDPKITVVKSAQEPNFDAAGDVLHFDFTVTNTGNMTLDNIVVSDPLPGLSTVVCQATVLAPGDDTTCAATYTATQADVDSGGITNTAVVSATTPSGAPITSAPTDIDVPAIRNLAATLVKTAVPAVYSDAGQPITYSFVVQNTGNVTIESLTVTDPLPGLGTITCDATRLAPNDTAHCDATYNVTQADLDAGHVDNMAELAVVGPPGTTFDPITDEATILADQQPTIEIVKRALQSSFDASGTVIDYEFEVRNTGNVTLSNIVVTDPLPDIDVDPCPITVLAPDEVVVCTAIYETTQGDLDAGGVANTAAVAAQDPNDGPVTASSQQVLVDAIQQPNLTLAKTASVATYSKPGDTITYTFTVTNTGNVTLTGVALTDQMLGASGAACGSPTPLAPGESTTCDLTYAVTQADVDAGSIVNTATVTATSPDPQQTPTTAATAAVTAIQAPSVTLAKSVDEPSFSAGMTLHFKFLVTNTGNVTLDGLTINDPMPGLSPVSCPTTTLAPGESTTCTATYVATAADVAAGRLTNTATVTASGTLCGLAQQICPAPITSQPSTVEVNAVVTPPPPPGSDVPNPGELPATGGGDLGRTLGLAALLLASGLGIVAAMRRRHRRP